MKFRCILLFAALFCAVVSVSRAAAVGGIHEAAVPVPDQSREAREAAFRTALQEVLVKVTGSRAAPAAPTLAGLLDTPSRYLASYRYEQETAVSEDGGAAEQRLLLHARFDSQAIARLVREAGLPLWGDERPITLVWLAVEDGRQRGLVGADDGAFTDAARKGLLATAAARGLPVVLPLLDAEDRTALAFADVWGGFEDRLLAASARYGADAVLAGSLHRAGGDSWAARWLLLEGGQVHRWQAQPGVLDTALAAGVDVLADSYAARFALRPRGEGGDLSVDMAVTGIAGLPAYARVLDYLGKLTPVRGVQVLGVSGNTLKLALVLRGDVQQLEQAISLGRLLKPEPMPAQVLTPQPDDAASLPPPAPALRYSYQP